MRSAVSAILSEPSDASPMAFPDYAQTAADHRRGLVLIVPVGTRLATPTFQKVRDRVTSVGKVSVAAAAAREPGGSCPETLPDAPPRIFRVRHIKSHPIENNDWGEFQMHRSLLGLVCVGGYGSPQELCELTRLHDAAKAKYSRTLLDTRLIAIGVSGPDDVGMVAPSNGDNGDSHGDDLSLPPLQTQQQKANNSSYNNGQQSCVLFYQSADFEETLEADTVDFVTGLFWILESRRREYQKSLDKLPFLCAPFERKDFVGLDLESRTNKKRTYGRHRKHLGDLNLLCDMPSEAQVHYDNAVDILRSCNDWIWLAGAMEGLCAIAVIISYPKIQRKASATPHRNASCNTLLKKHDRHLLLEDAIPLATFRVLKASDIVEKYRECVVHYSKYRHAGVIETEASIKAVQVLTEQCNHLLAAEFLQNIVFINLQMNDEEKIERFSALSRLYADIGFRRKSAFFLRVAAMRCVAPQNPHPDWGMCYQLLIKATQGYRLDLTDTVALRRKYNGWPALQIQLLQEMVGTARRMGNHLASTRHMTYLLEVLFDQLSESERLDFSQQLNVLTSRSGSNDEVIMEDALILPPVPMYKVPRVAAFSLCPLARHLVPRLRQGHRKVKESVFVFTPIQFGGGGSPDAANKISFHWVQGDVAEVCLTLFNPLPAVVKIVNLALLHEGVEFETFPSTLSLAASSGPHTVSLLGVPKEPGELKILGYTCTVLGVKSLCRLRGQGSKPTEYTIKVLPSLPQLDSKLVNLTSDDDNDNDEDEEEEEEEEEVVVVEDVVASSSNKEAATQLRMYHGETMSFELSFTNISNIAAKLVSVKCEALPLDMADMVQLSEWPDGFSLEAGQSSSLTVTVTAHKLLPGANNNDCDHDERNPNSLGSREGSFKRPSIVTLDLRLSYSGGPGGEQGYHRELVRSLVVDIVPSALVTKWDVLPAETVHENYLVLDIANRTVHEMDLHYNHKSLSIEPADVCRIPLSVSKFPLSEEARQQKCNEYLEKSIDVTWTLPRISKKGYVSVRDIKLDADMMASLELCQLEWDVVLNGQPLEGDRHTASIGCPLSIELKVRNDYGFPVDGEFFVDTYLEDGTRCCDLGDNLILQSQCESGALLKCQSGHVMRHVSTILPLAAGTFDVVCSCSVLSSSFKTDSANATNSVDTENQPFSFISKYPKIVIHVAD